MAVSTTLPDAPRRPDSAEISSLYPCSRRNSLNRLFTVNISASEKKTILALVFNTTHCLDLLSTCEDTEQKHVIYHF
jgi:hypothetical protein